jgi:hypothetical protein
MNKKLFFILLAMLFGLTSCGWGGRTYVGGANLDNRVAILPFKVYARVVPGFNDSWSAHYEFACWMLPGEKYTVLQSEIEGMRYIESGRCNGSAFVK